jgi:tRNA-dihydrouridine synthase
MIGRASLGRPWLAGEIAAALEGREKPCFAPEKLAEATTWHYDSLLGTMGEAHGIRHARKHVAAYAEEAGRRGAPIDRAQMAAALTSHEPAFVRAFLRESFLSIASSPVPEVA